MANKGQENLIPFNERTEEEQREIARQGGIRSGEVRREKATMKATLEKILDEKYKKTGKTYREMATLGLISGAVKGNAQNYKMIMEILGEMILSNSDEENEINNAKEIIFKIREVANESSDNRGK